MYKLFAHWRSIQIMRNLLTNDGYTLIDALFQLLVLLLLSHILFFYSLWMKDSKEMFLTTEQEEWELFSLDFETYLVGIQHIEEQADQNGIRVIQEGFEYDVELSGSLIRKQKNRLGHEPMLLHIKTARFKVNENQVLLLVEFENGISKERIYEVLLSP
ncbi:MAG: competence type IV pilus minor pilin ComGF [Paenisporosarcina sp.]